MTDRFPNTIGKVDERAIIAAFMATAQILAEWRRCSVLTGLKDNTLRDDALVINIATGDLLVFATGVPVTEEEIRNLQGAIDGASARHTKLRFSLYEFCLTGETAGEATMFCKCMAEIMQICNMINADRAQQMQAEAGKVQAATSIIDPRKGGYRN